MIDDIREVNEQDRTRVKMIFEFYRLLNQKYRLDNLELKKYLSSFNSENLPDTKKLVLALEENNLKDKILSLLSYMKDLKKIILSDKIYEANQKGIGVRWHCIKPDGCSDGFLKILYQPQNMYFYSIS